MSGLPVTIRLLDPPLHEFLPHDKAAQKVVADELGVGPAEINKRAVALHEANPMLGHRGCRLSITYPEILEMQVQAIVEAAINCAKKKIKANPEIMIPLVGTDAELFFASRSALKRRLKRQRLQRSTRASSIF